MEQINKRKYKNGDIYMATTDTKGEMVSPNEVPAIKAILDRVAELEQQLTKGNTKLVSTLKMLGVTPQEKFSDNLYLLTETLVKSRILQDDTEYTALFSLDGYVQEAIRISSIIKTEDTPSDIANKCYTLKGGVLELDLQKLAEVEDL